MCETHNALQLPVLFFSFFSFFLSSRDFASVIQNIGKFGEKSCFTDHQTANTIYHFRDSVRSLKETSRHIKLSHTNIALLLQEATQKYHKLTDYWTKSCYLSLCPSLCLLRFVLPSPSLQLFSFSSSLNITSDHLWNI